MKTREFVHDLNNIVFKLEGRIAMMDESDPNVQALTKTILQLSKLARDFDMAHPKKTPNPEVDLDATLTKYDNSLKLRQQK